jgi:hypothetical protein
LGCAGGLTHSKQTIVPDINNPFQCGAPKPKWREFRYALGLLNRTLHSWNGKQNSSQPTGRIMKIKTASVPSFLFCLLASGLTLNLHAAVYQESGGRVVVEAEHFHERTTSATGHRWAVIPDESGKPDAPVDAGFANARGGKYVQSLPDGGENRNVDTSVVGTGNVIDYKVQINTLGTYRLYLRWGGFDGASDSIYAEIVELRDGITGGRADWYRYSATVNGDFATAVNTATGGTAAGWNGSGAPAGGADQISGGPAGEVAATWAISTPGVYTVRISQREDGSALDAFILQLTSLAEPNDPGPTESSLATSYVLITQQPTDAAGAPGQNATFRIAATTGTATATYQWQRAAAGTTNFANITGATGTSYTTGTLANADHGALFRVLITIPGTTVASSAAMLIVDVIPPTIVRAGGNNTFNKVTLYFSEPLNPATATNLANYSATGGLTLSSPVLGSGGTTVTLNTSAQATNASYTISVKDVKDATGINVISPNPSPVTFHGWVLGNGVIERRLFTGIGGGTTVPDLTNSAPFIANQPNLVSYETAFEAPSGIGDNYGEQMRGYITAPTTGAYVFFIFSDDNSVLYLSTDDNPVNKKLIAAETAWSNGRQYVSSAGSSDLSSKRSDQYAGSQWPTPAQINLTAGRRYYIEALMKEGIGGDFFGVTWMLPNGTEPVDGDPPIPGSALSSFYNPDGSVTITQQPQNRSVAANASASFSVTASGVSDFGTNLIYQWQRAATGSSTFADIAGATAAQYTIPFAASSDNGSQYRAVVSSLVRGLSIDYSRTTSSAATLSVTSDSIPPTLVGVLGTPTSIRVSFSEPLDTATATAPANYKLNGNATVTKADVVSATGQAGVVALTATGVNAGQNYTLTVTGVKDLGGNTIASSTLSFDVFHIFSTFNDGNVPAGAGVGGGAMVLPSGSYDGSAMLQITTNAASLQGAIIYGDVLSGAAVNKFTALFKLFIGKGSGNPADGFSFNIASDLPASTSGSTTGEEGTGSGLTVAFDTYDNGGAEAPAIGLKWGGSEFVKTNVSKATLVNNQWVDVIIRVNADGTLDLYHNNVRYFNKEPIPGWSPIAGASVMLGARTGNENEVHWIDDLRLIYNADITVAEPPTIRITSPADNARLAANSSVAITVSTQTPGSSVSKVEYFANGSLLGTSTTAPYSFTVPNAPTGAYLVTARITAANGISVTSAPVKVVVGSPPIILFVTADPGPLTFTGDQAVYEHLLSRGYDVTITTGTDVPDDGSTALGKVLVVQSSSLGSGTTVAAAGGSKYKNVAVPVVVWESSNADDLGFQAANGATGANQTDVNIVDATSPLAAGFPAGPVTVVTSPQTFSTSTPVGAHVVATIVGDPTQAVIYNYDKGEKGDGGFTMPARRVFFFFQDTTAAAANANGWKLFDAAMDWALNKTVTAAASFASTRLSAGTVILTWTGTGTLQSASSVTGPWADVAGASSPFTVTAPTGNKFYRIRQ